MKQVQSLLVGVDLSDCSKSALHQSARISRWSNATLHVLHVVESLVVSDLAEALGISVDEARQEVVEGARDRLQKFMEGVDVPAKVDVDVVVGAPVEEILRKTEAVKADLVVLGVYGFAGSGRGAGTFATECVREIDQPILLVGESQVGAFRSIAVAVDFSETSKAAVRAGALIAQADGARLDLFHVFYGPWRRLHYRSPTREATPDFQEQYKAALKSRLERLRKECLGTIEGIEVRCELFECSGHGYGIIDYAGEAKSDLVVLGTRGRTNLTSILLGSTAERVLRETRCSLLAVSPQP